MKISSLTETDSAFARKLLKVNRESPVMKLKFDDVKKFINKHPALKGQLGFNPKGDKILLDTKAAAKLYIKLMDDDFLRSDLTQRLYDSIAKNTVAEEKKKKKNEK